MFVLGQTQRESLCVLSSCLPLPPLCAVGIYTCKALIVHLMYLHVPETCICNYPEEGSGTQLFCLTPLPTFGE